jgi:hypothetical protein
MVLMGKACRWTASDMKPAVDEVSNSSAPGKSGVCRTVADHLAIDRFVDPDFFDDPSSSLDFIEGDFRGLCPPESIFMMAFAVIDFRNRFRRSPSV